LPGSSKRFAFCARNRSDRGANENCLKNGNYEGRRRPQVRSKSRIQRRICHVRRRERTGGVFLPPCGGREGSALGVGWHLARKRLARKLSASRLPRSPIVVGWKPSLPSALRSAQFLQFLQFRHIPPRRILLHCRQECCRVGIVRNAGKPSASRSPALSFAARC
jgi:hypothetical protein